MEHRDDSGKFTRKSDSERKVRSIRATDHVWDDFGFEADKRRITRADLLEQWVKDAPVAPVAPVAPAITPMELAIAMAILNDALDLKANAGGAIKAKIREALEVLQ